jgi:23S rRNA (cytidine1920-2'-O)/16S rRNA (cytidine1409-2'-O)-methyltransferase
MKKRLDQLLVERGYFSSRSRAQAAILAGLVYVEGQKVDKSGKLFSPEAEIEVRREEHPYVSRGGVKLEKALKEFKVKVKGKVALDIGASTGGFTDCLLQHGAARVYAVDVGYGQLAWKLRRDPRVKVIERTNVRHLTFEKFKEIIPSSPRAEALRDEAQFPIPTMAVIDVSFISLSKILPAVYNLLADGAEVLALIKPQFEARREQVGKGGIIKDKKVHEEVIEKAKAEAEAMGFRAKGIIQSPITGADGNIEFFIHLSKEAKT